MQQPMSGLRNADKRAACRATRKRHCISWTWRLLAAAGAGGACAARDASCDFERVHGDSAAASTILAAAERPIVLTGLLGDWLWRTAWPTAEAFGNAVGSTSGYARDHDQLELRDADTTVEEYLAGCHNTSRSSSAAFFVNDYEDSNLLDKVRSSYTPPRLLKHIEALRVFSLECQHAGVSFHRHEQSWQAQVVGQKSWYLIDPSIEAVPLQSPCLFEEDGAPPMAEHCDVMPGEVLYVPDNWWHATCSTSTEASVAIGGVGSVREWPEVLLAARFGNVPSMLRILADFADAVDAVQVPQGKGIFVGGERPLYLAAALGHAAVLEALLSKGAQVDAQRRDGRTALHEASRRGNVQIVERLHTAGAKLDITDGTGSTALHHACSERGHVVAVEYLLKHGARPSSLRNDGRSALHVACRSHRSPVALLRALLQGGGVAPGMADSEGITPLMLCAGTGHAKAVGLLIRFGGADAVHRADKSGRNALDHALAGRGDEGVVSRLLGAGSEVDGRRVVAAARLGELAALQLLAKKAGNGSVAGCMLEAAKAGHASVIKLLATQFEGDVDERDHDGGATPLHSAVLSGHLGATSALLAAGANSSMVDNDGLLAMHYAAMIGSQVRFSRQKALMGTIAHAKGVDPEIWNRGDARGTRPLHFAAAAGHMDLVRWLVLESAVSDPRLLDNQGNSAADIADQAKHSELAEWLRVEIEKVTTRDDHAAEL